MRGALIDLGWTAGCVIARRRTTLGRREPARLDRRALRRPRHRDRGRRGADPRPRPRRRPRRRAPGGAHHDVPARLRRRRPRRRAPRRLEELAGRGHRARGEVGRQGARRRVRGRRPRATTTSSSSTPTEDRCHRRPRVGRMRAVIAPDPGGPEALVVADLPDPTPGPGEVVVDVAASGGQPRRHRCSGRASTRRRRVPPTCSGLECSGHDQRRRRRRRRAGRWATRSAPCWPAAGTPSRCSSPPGR